MRAAIFLLLVSWATLGLGAERVQQLLPNGDFNTDDLAYWNQLGGWLTSEEIIPNQGYNYYVFPVYCPNNLCALSQEADVPGGKPALHFSLQNLSETVYCGYVRFEVYINLLKVFTEDLCLQNAYDYWQDHSVDLRNWSGTKNVSIAFVYTAPTPLPDQSYGWFYLDRIFFEYDALIFGDSFEGANQ